MGAINETGVQASSAASLSDASTPVACESVAGQRTICIRNAYVMTMDAELGDLPVGDVLVRDGLIDSVGEESRRGERRSNQRPRHAGLAGLHRLP